VSHGRERTSAQARAQRERMNVTIIIPSTCEEMRAATLRRAMESLLEQRGVVPRVLIVANGNRSNPALMREIAAIPGVTVEYQMEASLPNALRHGVSRLATEYYGFLDDDDEYLPDALALRCAAMESRPDVDVVVTNGYEHRAGADRLRVKHLGAAAQDPLRALLAQNWLASCGALFRASRVPVSYFDGVTRYYEWTFLAFKLAMTRRIEFIDVPTFRVHESPQSLSKSLGYSEAEVGALRQIRDLELPSDVKAALAAKIGHAHHALADVYLARGQRALALRHHMLSLLVPGWTGRLAYSRRLLPGWPTDRPPA